MTVDEATGPGSGARIVHFASLLFLHRTMSDLAIATHDLTRRFGDHVAVDRINLEVPRQTVYGFLGPNGAGKSTTIRMLLGLLRPDEGHVHLLGRPLATHREDLLREVGALVEAPSVYEHLTGRENLRVTGYLRGSVPASAVDRALGLVNLRDAADKRVRAYSMGMKQRLGLALALLHEPRLLILDEPTNGLDPAGIHEMRTLIREVPDRAGVTVFVSSHLLSEIELMASHVGIIHDGRLVFQGSTNALKARQRPRVVLGTNRPDEAQRVLADASLDAVPADDGQLIVHPGDKATAAQCAAALVHAGLDVHHVDVRQSSLEDTFLSLTAPS
jgi:ABC-2 type transport system ATP-binding protein